MALAIARHFRPRRAVPRRTTWETRVDPTWIESLLTESVRLNQTGRSFTRATSAWDPVHNCILAPGQPRQVYARYRDRVSIPLDLPEGARTNLLAAGSSENMTIAAWSHVNTTAVFTAGLAPDGISPASKLTESTDGGATAHENYQSAGTFGAVAAGTPTSISFYWFPENNRGISVYLKNNYTTDYYNAIFLPNGTSGGTGHGSNSSLASSSINPAKGMPAGWYYCTIVGVHSTVTANPTFDTYLTNSSGNTTYQGSGLVAGILWGWQCEAAAFPSSYISNRNLHIQSNNFGNGAWTKLDTTITSNSVANPLSGLTDVALITEGSAGTALLYNTSSFAVTSGATFTVTRYVKRGNTDEMIVRVVNNANNSGFQAWVNLNLGTVGTFAAVGTGTAVSKSIAAVPGYPGWYRVALTGTIGAFTTAAVITQSASADNSTTRVANSTRYEANAQFEYGAAATAYWGTNATVGGRDGETLNSTGALPITAGTFHFIGMPINWGPEQGSAATAFRPFEDTANTGIFCNRTGSGTVQVRRYDAGGAESTIGTVTPWASGVILQLDCIWDTVSVRSYVNGLASGTPKTGLTPPFTAGAGVIAIGCATTLEFYGYCAILQASRAWTDLENKLVGQYAKLALGQA